MCTAASLGSIHARHSYLRIPLTSTMSSSQSKPTSDIQEIIDATERIVDEEASDSGDAREDEHSDDANQPSTSSASKKKKKKKSKAAKALQSLKPNKIPQAVVNEVLSKVKAEPGMDQETVNADTVRLALDQLKLMDYAKGKTGIGGMNKKDAGDHKVSLTSIHLHSRALD